MFGKARMSVRGRDISNVVVEIVLRYGVARTNKAAVTDSSHRSRRNSSRAMDSLSMLMTR